MVGRPGFEPGIPWTQTRNHSQARPPTHASRASNSSGYKTNANYKLITKVITAQTLNVLGERRMSLLGPDDFGLGRKGRKKKLAKDLSPDAQKFIEEWLEREDDPEAFERLSELVGPDEARRLIAQRKRRKKRLNHKDPLRE